MSDPQTELELHLGRVVRNGQAFETTMGNVLAQSLNVAPEVGTSVGGLLGVAKALQLIDLLAGAPEYPLNPQDVKNWVKQARKANEMRNAAIHDPWAAVAETGEFTRTLFHGWRGRLASLAELDEVATRLNDAIVAGRALLKG
jgi:hypothetical protein